MPGKLVHLIPLYLPKEKEAWSGFMAYFGSWQPVPGDVLRLTERRHQDHPMFGLWEVVRREFSNVGDDEQHIRIIVRPFVEEAT